MTRETEAKAVLNRIVVAHNRLHRSEITPAEFDQFALKKLSAFADAEAAAMRERAAAVPRQVSGIIGAHCGSSIDSALCEVEAAILALPATGEVGRG